MPHIDLGGASLYYEFTGKRGAPVLVLSSSLGTTLRMWDPQMDDFNRQFQVLRYDMRGHGKSSATPGPYTIGLLGGDVLAMLDGLGIAHIHFCGLSVGGAIGQWLAIREPSRIDRLALSNTAAKIGTAEAWDARFARVQQEGMAAIADSVIERWFTPPFLARGEAIVGTMRQMLAAADPLGYVATCAALRAMDQREEVASIQPPTLVIGGEFDLATPFADSEFLARQIPGAMLVKLPAAHISSAELPSQFNAAVLGFLSNGDAAEVSSTQDGAA